MSQEQHPVDSSDWYATVKYSGFSTSKEYVPVCKIKYVTRARDGTVLRTEPWQPKSLTDIDKSGYNYSVLTSLNTKSGKEERFYAIVAALAETLEKAENYGRRLVWPNVSDPVSDPPTTTDNDVSDESDSDHPPVPSTQLEVNRIARAKKNSLKRTLTMSEYHAYYKKKNKTTGETINDQNTVQVTTQSLPLENHLIEPIPGSSLATNSLLVHSLVPASSASSQSNSVQGELAFLRKQLEESQRRTNDFERFTKFVESIKKDFDTKMESLVNTVTCTMDVMTEKINVMETKLDTANAASEVKFQALGKHLEEVSDLISKSPYHERLMSIQSWVDSIA